jgi:hypothetical protein
VSVFIVALLLENMEGHYFPRAFEKRENFLYTGKFFMRNLRAMKKRPCKWAAFYIGALLGTWRGFTYWDF